MSHNPYKICMVQANCMRASNITMALCEVCKESADIVLVQEPFFFQNSDDLTIQITDSHSAFHRLMPQQADRQPRVVTYITNSNHYLEYQPRPDITDNPDLLYVEINSSSIVPIHFLNIYNEEVINSNSSLRPTELALLGDLPPNRTILAGDMNCHHPMWDSRVKKPKNADNLIAIIDREDLDMINTPDVDTYNYRNRKGRLILDLAFVRQDIQPPTCNWAVNPELHSGSDHEVVTFVKVPDSIETFPVPTRQRYY